MESLPKIIWMYWHQGFDQAPEIVNECVKSWQKHHISWEINLLDSISINSFIEQIPISISKLNELSLAHRSDLIRTQLLIQYGGVWVDPTCFCLKPLDEWLFRNFQAGLFLFYKPGRDRIISNWFIAAEKENVVLSKLMKELCLYWENNSFRNFGNQKVWYEAWIKKVFNQSLSLSQMWFTSFVRKRLRLFPYMIYHYMFYRIIRNNVQCENYWKKMPKISANEPHKLQFKGLLTQIDDDTIKVIDSKSIPLFKLTWKINQTFWSKNSVLGYLFCQNKY